MSKVRDTGYQGSTKQKWGSGLSLFGAIVLITVGSLEVLQGLAAIAKDDVFVVTPDYLYKFDLTTWGWIHLLVGIAAIAAGAGIVAGQDWARVLGILLAVGSAIVNFVSLPYYPFWSITVIALDIAVIWALATTMGRDPRSL